MEYQGTHFVSKPGPPAPPESHQLPDWAQARLDEQVARINARKPAYAHLSSGVWQLAPGQDTRSPEQKEFQEGLHQKIRALKAGRVLPAPDRTIDFIPEITEVNNEEL